MLPLLNTMFEKPAWINRVSPGVLPSHALEVGDRVASQAMIEAGLRVPLSLLSPLVTDIENAFGWRIPARTPAMQLLTGYLRVVKDVADAELPELRHRAVTRSHDLVELAIG